MRARAAAAVLLLALAACSSRPLPDDDDAGNDGDPTADPTAGELDPGDQPTTPGVMYSPCEVSAQCPPLEFCVFPQGESGYCTSACASPTDPSSCAAPPGDQDQTCFDIGLQDGRWVCALDCTSAPCPRGMRCEEVATGAGERSICF